MSRQAKHAARKRRQVNPQPPPSTARFSVRQRLGLGVLVVVLILSPFLWRAGSREWQLHQAQTELTELEVQPALNRLSKLAEQHPEHPEVLFWLARAERRSGDLQSAVQHFRQAGEAGADESQIEVQFQLMEAQAGRVSRAEPFVKQFSATSDDLLSEEVYEALAQGFMFTGRFQDALACLAFWIDWRQEKARPRLYRAEIWERTQNWKKAIEEYETVLGFDPENIAARGAYARCLLQYQDGAAALEQYQQLLSLRPDDADWELGRCKALEKQGEISLAQAGYEQLLLRELSRENREETLIGLGRTALFSGQPEEARKLLLQALEINPGNYQTHFHLTGACSRLNLTEEAELHRKTSQQLSAAQARFREILDELSASPRDAELRIEAGTILEQLGLTDQATAWWLAAAEINPDASPVHRRLEAHYRREGNQKLAEKHRQLAEQTE